MEDRNPAGPADHGQPETAAEPRPSLRDTPLFASPSSWSSPTAYPASDTPSARSAPVRPDVSAPRPTSRGWIDADKPIDWALVRRLKAASVDEVEKRIADYRQRHGKEPSAEDDRELGKPLIAAVVADHARAEAARGTLWPPELEDRYFKAVFDSQFGFGRLQPLFEIPDAESISVNGCDSIRVIHSDGRITRLPPVADSDDELMEQIQQIGANSRPRRTLDAHNLDMTLMLGHQFRLHAISNEISVRPRIAIRQHLLQRISIADLSVRGAMPDEVARLLDSAVRANQTIAVAGEQSAGKTTLLRALVDAVPDDQAFGTLETDLELFAHLMPGRDNELAMHARTGMGERTESGKRIGEIGISSMINMALRQTLDRFIVGEIRGSEASALFQAMATGTGTMFTLHSRNPETVPIRLASRIAEGRVYTIEEALRQIGLLVDLIVYVELIDDRLISGTRRRAITQIAHCSPGEYGRPAISSLYTTDIAGNPASFNPPPDLLQRLSRHRRPSLHRHEA